MLHIAELKLDVRFQMIDLGELILNGVKDCILLFQRRQGYA